jgi:uncharacterized protein (DUF697 family)
MRSRLAVPLARILGVTADADLGMSIVTSIFGVALGLVLAFMLALDMITNPDR